MIERTASKVASVNRRPRGSQIKDDGWALDLLASVPAHRSLAKTPSLTGSNNSSTKLIGHLGIGTDPMPHRVHGRSLKQCEDGVYRRRGSMGLTDESRGWQGCALLNLVSTTVTLQPCEARTRQEARRSPPKILPPTCQPRKTISRAKSSRSRADRKQHRGKLSYPRQRSDA
jgi:hypothetical protein